MRAFAVLTILLSHWEGYIYKIFPNSDIHAFVGKGMLRLFEISFWANGGLHPGVVIFIVLSGFCVHLSHRTMQHNYAAISHDLGYWISFFIKRVMRVYPVYLCGVILGCISIAIEISRESIVINAHSVSINNIILSLLQFYAIAPVEAPQGNGILNTVSVLFAIYITYPWMLYVLKRFGWKAVFVLGIVIHLFNVFFVIIHADVIWISRNYYCCILYWIIGMYAADKYFNGMNIVENNHYWACGLSFMAYIVAGNIINFKGAHYFKTLLFAVLTGWFLRIACHNGQRIILWKYKILSMLAWIGKRSYSLYSVHLPAISITMTCMAYSGVENELLIRIITLCSTCILILLSYNYIENPAQRIMHKRM